MKNSRGPVYRWEEDPPGEPVTLVWVDAPADPENDWARPIGTLICMHCELPYRGVTSCELALCAACSELLKASEGGEG